MGNCKSKNTNNRNYDNDSLPNGYGYTYIRRPRRSMTNLQDSESSNVDYYDLSSFDFIGEVRMARPAPKWKATAVYGNGDMKEISLENFKGKYVVLFFYPMDFTFVCPTEILAFSDRYEEFKEIDCEVLAASTDTKYCHLAWINTPRGQGGLGKLNIPLIADKNCTIARRYGIYKPDDGISFRGLFIIDSAQNIRQVTINDNAVGRSVDETLRLVKAFQFTDKFGELCPANWKPGDGGIKATNNPSNNAPTSSDEPSANKKGKKKSKA